MSLAALLHRRARLSSNTFRFTLPPFLSQELFREIDARKDDVSCEVALSYLEVYNETIRDLLEPSDNMLAIREDASKGVSSARDPKARQGRAAGATRSHVPACPSQASSSTASACTGPATPATSFRCCSEATPTARSTRRTPTPPARARTPSLPSTFTKSRGQQT